MSEDNASPNASAATADSAPATLATETPTPAATADSAPASENAASTESPNPSEPQGEEQSKAVKELISQRKRRQQAEQEAAYWRGIAEGKGYKPAMPVATPQQQAPQLLAPPVLPVLDNFESFEDFETAKTNYTVARAKYEMQQEVILQQQQRRQQELRSSWEKRLETAAKTDPTVYDVVSDPSLPVSHNMGVIIQTSDLGVDILKYLNANRQEAARIATMDPIMAARELGAIEAKIRYTPPPEPPKKVSAAPEPIPTVTPTGSSVVDEDSLPTEEWIARRNKQAGYR